MKFDEIVNELLEGHKTPFNSQSYRKSQGADYDQDVKHVGGNSDSKMYWTITRPDGTKYYMTKEPKFKGKNVKGPFRGTPPKE